MELGNYIFNLTTEKIELRFAKSDYLALTDEQKTQIKSNFLWSSKGGCWVSRCKEPNLFWARKVAMELGFTGEEREGERLTFAEKLEAQKERAEERAERYEERAESAERRGAIMCSALEAHNGDISFFTQPIIAGHAGSRRFANYREKLYAQYDKGMGEYKKSEYYHDRAQTALETAAMTKLNDKGYLMRQIKECKKEIKAREGNIINYEEKLYRIEQGETLMKRYDQTIITAQDLETAIQRELELVNKAMDKQAFMEDRLAALGGVTFSKENIKAGYVVQIGRWMGKVVSTGPQNIQYRSPCGLVLTAAYAEITKVLKAEEAQKTPHPFEVGDTFEVLRYDLSKYGERIPTHTYKIIKTTDVSVTIKNQTVPDEKAQTLRPKQSKFNANNWDLTIRGTWFQKSTGKEVIKQ